ncbi:Ig-like domain-containing protein [Kibdelosporangium persicum]|uniref:Lipoprotein-anchoring transpeptidase ErfK/SrfK n=1 Tax=Kibdelosporangium persicum TaxID=2698649 RepID=A0ABX2F4M3_9PSEU|nr:Ig-like domain-containing protein [Kibdelosporangium persicum]NRN65911.1 Lipoprotein-anchoring transpeptidase ErfK/SrfK [Kibdelosporangium persicum]
MRRSIVAIATALAVLSVAGCSSGDSPSPQPTDGAPAPAGQTSSASPAPQPKPIAMSVTPADKAAGVAPGDPITVTAADGKLTQVSVTNQDGKAVSGTLSPDGLKWESSEPLGYSKSYTVNAAGTGTDGKPSTITSSFTTVKPGKQIGLSMIPQDGQTVGVGQPLAFYFSGNVADKAAAEKALRITAEPATEGAFHWFRDNEVHWRPKEYWKSGTKITVNAAIYGKALGPGVFGKEDRKAAITIGNKVVAVADGATKQMTVSVNDQVVKTIPISLGKPKHETPNGIYTVMSEQQNYTMDSGTYGVPADSPGGYRTKVEVASRLSNSGIFYHSAPWSLKQQGNSNVSHGCINMSTENARWMQEIGNKGDIFEVRNSGGKPLQAWDGLSDWQLSWDEYKKGGKK